LGVGIDYALRIVTRFREELNRGLAPVDAAVRTIQTAGSAVVTSGLTVVVGFAALTLTPLTETRSVGVGGLIVVAVAVLLATTFLPGALAILGRDIDRPKWLARMLAWIHTPQGWERWARYLGHRPWRAILRQREGEDRDRQAAAENGARRPVARYLGHRPWRAILGGGLAVAILTFPLTQIKIGLPVRNWFPPDAESGQGLQALREMGASGVIQPLRVVVQLPPGESALSGRRLPGLKALSDSIAKDPRVREVRGVATLRPGMSILQLAMYYADAEGVRERYPEFFNAYLSADRRTTLMDVIAVDSVSLTGMMDLARHVRGTIARSTRLHGVEVVVGGFAASSLDLQENLLGRFPGIVAMILGVTAIMLFIAFRSVLVPLKAVVLNCVSVSAAFGITVLV